MLKKQSLKQSFNLLFMEEKVATYHNR